MYSAIIIARYIINKKFEEGAPVNNERLQSLSISPKAKATEQEKNLFSKKTSMPGNKDR